MGKTKDTRSRIIEAFSSDGCPLCAMLRRDELDSLYQWVGQSNENAGNSERIRRLWDAGGFCNYHFWRLAEMSTHYGIANIAAQLIEKLLEISRADKLNRPSVAECPLCNELREKEGDYFGRLPGILKNQESSSQYEKSSGLCMPHYLKAIDCIDDDSLLDFLYETQINQLANIKNNAESFINKRNPPQRWSQTKNEKI